MQYNECKTCGAKDGRAGNLTNGECHDCLQKKKRYAISFRGDCCAEELPDGSWEYDSPQVIIVDEEKGTQFLEIFEEAVWDSNEHPPGDVSSDASGWAPGPFASFVLDLFNAGDVPKPEFIPPIWKKDSVKR